MRQKRFLIDWIDGETGQQRKASVKAATEKSAFNKLLKDKRYEESLFLTFGSKIDKQGHLCVNIREVDINPKKFNAIYL